MHLHPEDKQKIDLSFEWCYRCEGDKAIKGIHPVSLDEDHYILLSSMDNNLHILKRNGISVNTIHLKSPLNQIYIPRQDQQKKANYINAFVTTFNNKFQKIRLFQREELKNEINQCFDGKRRGYETFKDGDSQILLHKFRSIDIFEKYFKIRYYLKSDKFDSPTKILAEIDSVFKYNEFEDRNHAITSLLHRLFFDYVDLLLNDKERFLKVKQLFIRTRELQGHKASKAYLKTQIYWIRSLFKGCENSGNPVKTLNTWFNVSRETAMPHKLGLEVLKKIDEQATFEFSMVFYSNHFNDLPVIEDFKESGIPESVKIPKTTDLDDDVTNKIIPALRNNYKTGGKKDGRQ